MQSAAPVQFINVPPKPTCMPQALTIFGGGPECQDRWNAYNQAVQQRQLQEAQLYVNHEKELATAPLEQQIADLDKVVSDQQTQLKQTREQMQADASAALQAKAAAHTQGLEYGAGIGMGASLFMFGVIFAIRKLMGNFTVTKKPQAHATAAGK